MATQNGLKKGDEDFFKVRELDKNHNLCIIVARDKDGKERGRREVKFPKLSAPLSVWVEFCKGEMETKLRLSRSLQVSMRATIHTSSSNGKGKKKGALHAALS